MISKTHKTTGEVTEFTWDYRNRLTRVVVKDGNGTVTAEARYRYDVFNRRIMIWEDDDGAGPNDPQVTWVVNDNLQPPSAAELLAVGTRPATASEISNSLKSSITTGNALPAGIPAPLVDAVLLSDFFAANPLIDFVDPDGPGPQPAVLHVRRLYGPAIDMLLSRTFSGGSSHWYAADGIGSVRLIVTPVGVVVDEIAYASYGAVLAETSPAAADRLKYSAREWDDAILHQFNRGRYYSTETGRFISEDPIRFRGGGTNIYEYGLNVPVAGADPLGLQPPDPVMDYRLGINRDYWDAYFGNTLGTPKPPSVSFEQQRGFIYRYGQAGLPGGSRRASGGYIAGPNVAISTICLQGPNTCNSNSINGPPAQGGHCGALTCTLHGTPNTSYNITIYPVAVISVSGGAGGGNVVISGPNGDVLAQGHAGVSPGSGYPGVPVNVISPGPVTLTVTTGPNGSATVITIVPTLSIPAGAPSSSTVIFAGAIVVINPPTLVERSAGSSERPRK